MSPEGRISASVLARLLREIEHDRGALAQHEQDARSLLSGWTDDRRSLALAAVALHGWYTGLESLTERILRALDGDAPTGASWHRDLLLQAIGELPRVRPALLPQDRLDDLLALLKFRHFFRHAYGAELDPVRLRSELERMHRIAPEIARSLQDFRQFLEEALEALS